MSDQTTPTAGMSEEQIDRIEERYQTVKRLLEIHSYGPTEGYIPAFLAGCRRVEEYLLDDMFVKEDAIPALIAEVRDRGREIERLGVVLKCTDEAMAMQKSEIESFPVTYSLMLQTMALIAKRVGEESADARKWHGAADTYKMLLDQAVAALPDGDEPDSWVMTNEDVVRIRAEIDRKEADARLGAMCRKVMSEYGGMRADSHKFFDPQFGASIYRYGDDGRHVTHSGHGATFEEALSSALAALRAAQEEPTQAEPPTKKPERSCHTCANHGSNNNVDPCYSCIKSGLGDNWTRPGWEQRQAAQEVEG